MDFSVVVANVFVRLPCACYGNFLHQGPYVVKHYCTWLAKAGKCEDILTDLFICR